MHKPTMRSVSRWMVISLVVIVGASVTLHGALVHTPAPGRPLVAGSALNGRLAPDFALRDQDDQMVRLSDLRGHIVVVTFLDANCASTCTVTAQCMDQTALMLGVQSSNVEWLAVSVNPSNTLVDAQSFVDKHHMTVPLHVLLGSRDQLSAIWQAYSVRVPPTRSTAGSAPSSAVSYVIDATGHERELLDQSYDPKAAARDIRTLLGGASAGTAAREAWRVRA